MRDLSGLHVFGKRILELVLCVAVSAGAGCGSREFHVYAPPERPLDQLATITSSVLMLSVVDETKVPQPSQIISYRPPGTYHLLPGRHWLRFDYPEGDDATGWAFDATLRANVRYGIASTVIEGEQPVTDTGIAPYELVEVDSRRVVARGWWTALKSRPKE